jgi:hypothetical protein
LLNQAGLLQLDIERFGMVAGGQGVGQQPRVGWPGVGVDVLGREGTAQAQRDGRPLLLLVAVESLAGDRLDQPVHDQRLRTGLD